MNKIEKSWNPELAGKAAGQAERGGGPAEAFPVRRPQWWKPGTTASTTSAARSSRGGRRGNLDRKLDRVLGKVERETDE